jgi:hypothetical protein
MKYLKAIASEPSLARDHTLKSQELDVVIEYRPGQEGSNFSQ